MNKRIFYTLVLAAFMVLQLSSPGLASFTETVHVNEVFEEEYKMVITRPHGEMYIVAYAVGNTIMKLYEGDSVIIFSPSDHSFAGFGSKISFDDRDDIVAVDYSEQIIGDVTYPVREQSIKDTLTRTVFNIDSNVSWINGTPFQMDVSPYIKNGRTYLPLRYVGRAIGIADKDIVWDEATKTVTLTRGDKVVKVKVNDKSMLINGVSIPMDAAAEIRDGRAMLPIRFFAQSFGAPISWDEAARSVVIISS
ncbi:MAG: copper amine oxidase N-terminal domain-containing protein [Firmicutes bacterium]|nr:copper amine oxidase N-terminal domain-containing protein [Bacillota bacterium]